MKKLYMLGLALLVASVAGCTLKGPNVPALTGDVLEITWTATPVVSDSTMQEVTGAFDSGVVPVVTGSEGTSINSGVTAEVKDLINQRETQPKDESKLTEEDIGLMEEIIQKVQDLGK